MAARVRSDAQKRDLPADGVRLHDGGRGAHAYADAVITYLALGISRLADMCNAFCMWESSRTQVRHLFTRQAIPMIWDFAENNVFNDAGGDFRTSLGSVVRALERLPATGMGRVAQRDARARVRESAGAVISTDPPYYDNVPYADISDFFYVWMRANLSACVARRVLHACDAQGRGVDRGQLPPRRIQTQCGEALRVRAWPSSWRHSP